MLEQKQGIWKRYLIGALLIVASAATAVAVASFNEVNRVVDAFRHSHTISGLDKVLASADAGKPQTILLLGSDHRAKTSRDARTIGNPAHSDTIMLVRLDPAQRATALLSIPRDLKVDIPGHGIGKINSAYTYGGPKLTVETIKNLTGLRINHVINIDFAGFRYGVDELGCVWIDVDRRYYNENTGPGSYATINVPAGYQRLCGCDALDYVRYRHLDNDVIRAQRQQGFIRQAKDQIGVGRLFNDRQNLLNIFSKFTSSDIRSRTAVLRILELVIQSAGNPITQIHFPAQLGPSYVTASQAAIAKTTRQFLGVKSSGLSKPSEPGSHRKHHHGGNGLVGAGSMGKQEALQLVAHGARGLQIFYPRQMLPGDSFISDTRNYAVAVGGRRYGAYRIVVKTNAIGDYWGLQGIGWSNPPLLREPSEVKKVGGRKFFIYGTGANPRTVAWHSGGAVYWISNTLEQTLTRAQMLAIASSAKHL